MEIGNKLQVVPRLQISQNQIHSLEILAMDSTQLQEFMQNEYLENPLLDYMENQDTSHGSEDIRNHYELNITYGKTYEEIIEEDDVRSRDLPAADPDCIKESLLYQLPYQNLTALQLRLYEYMSDCLDETGFFTTPLDEVAKQTKLPLSMVKNALHTLQQLEPHGIFARNLRECLLIQLDFLDLKMSNTWKVVDKHLQDVASGKISTISHALSLTTAQVRKCIEDIAKLNPRPMNSFSCSTNKYSIPDIIFKKENDHWEIELNDHWIESYQINDYYMQLIKESHDEDLKIYFQTKLDRIRFIQNSITQRRQTIMRIAEKILSRQLIFFEGKGLLKPMTMATLADDLQIHPSTVGRAIKSKIIQYPAGTMPLRELFSVSISGSSEDDSLSATQIKEMIHQLVLAENKQKPLSDQKILSLLNAKGISISRRAVTQYREALGIKNSYVRKESYETANYDL